MQSVLLNRGITIGLDRLIKETARENGLVFPIEIIPFLHSLGISFKYPISKDKLKEMIEGNVLEIMQDVYGANRGRKIWEGTHEKNLLDSAKYVLENEIGEEQEVDEDYLTTNLKFGTPVVLVNNDRLHLRPNRLKGHYIHLVGEDSKRFYYDDSGPDTYGRDIPVLKKHLLNCMKLNWHDGGVIIL